MKIIISLLGTVFLAATTFAQEESASPEESTAPATEEKASATVQETPAAKPAESAAVTTEKKAEAATSPATAQKKETATTAAKPAASVASAASTSKTTAKNLNPRDAENAWEAAIQKHDVPAVESFIATDFMGVSSKNKFVSRSDVLGELKRDKDTYKSAKNDKLNVKMFGPNIAVVTGRAHEVGTGKDGKAFNRTFLFTDTWMMRAGKWQCIASHATKIKG